MPVLQCLSLVPRPLWGAGGLGTRLFSVLSKPLRGHFQTFLTSISIVLPTWMFASFGPTKYVCTICVCVCARFVCVCALFVCVRALFVCVRALFVCVYSVKVRGYYHLFIRKLWELGRLVALVMNTWKAHGPKPCYNITPIIFVFLITTHFISLRFDQSSYCCTTMQIYSVVQQVNDRASVQDVCMWLGICVTVVYCMLLCM